ncbi:MAG: hypothetical protein AB7I09_19875 [Planctomycetota bacterium]
MAPLVEDGPYPIHHLTRVRCHLRFAAWLDGLPVVGWILGSIGVLWLPVVVGTAMAIALAHMKYPSLCWTGGGLIALQVVAGLVAHLAKKHGEFASGVATVHALRDFLDWMHAEVFSKNTNTRISVMVRVRGKHGPELKVLLRPSAFPSRSDTGLAVRCNEGVMEGAAGVCYCEGSEQRIEVTADPESDEAGYAAESRLSVEKVRNLTRKAKFYLAHPIEASAGPHVGVLIVDHLKYPRILDEESKAACERAEKQVAILVQWVAQQLRQVPAKIRERA